jgi:hypothetical protein
MKVIDNVFVLADMQSHQLFICNGFSFDIFSSIGVFKSIDSLLKLTA